MDCKFRCGFGGGFEGWILWWILVWILVCILVSVLDGFWSDVLSLFFLIAVDFRIFLVVFPPSRWILVLDFCVGSFGVRCCFRLNLLGNSKKRCVKEIPLRGGFLDCWIFDVHRCNGFPDFRGKKSTAQNDFFWRALFRWQFKLTLKLSIFSNSIPNSTQNPPAIHPKIHDDSYQDYRNIFVDFEAS